MKRILALSFLMILSSLSLFAAQNSLKVTLSTPTHVGNATLPAGECKISWVVTGSEAQVTFQSSGQKPVTLPANVVKASNDVHALGIADANGVQVLTSVILEKMTFNLHPTFAPANGN
jgi:hypothetical protein